MRARWSLGALTKIFLLAVFLGLSPARPAEAGHLRSDAAQMFYLKLAPYGTWVHHRIYGRVWFPRNVPAYWRPYQDGYWAYTNDYGWVWVSDWEWGWATDHYGRWVWDDWYGWIWVPGAVWAPAWVVWRYGGGYVSWAPMPIQYIWNPYGSHTASYFDFDRYIDWDCWVTTRERDFPRRNKPRKWLSPKMNREILHRTRYADPLLVIDKNIVNRGVPVGRIERATRSSFKSVVPRVVREPAENWARARRQRNRDEVLIYRPIDNQPTAEALRDEAEIDRALAEKIHLNRRFSSGGKGPADRFSEPRRPGRLTGQPAPLDYQPAEPAQYESDGQRQRRPDGTGRFRRPDEQRIDEQTGKYKSLEQRMPQERERRARSQEPAGQERRQQLDLERQQQAEEARMRREAIQWQEEARRDQQQRQLERQQQAEEARMRQEAFGRREETARRQQLELQRQRRIEQERIQEGAIRQHQQNRVRHPRAEQERMRRDIVRRQREVERRGGLGAERQRQRMQQETLRRQGEAVRQQQREMGRRLQGGADQHRRSLQQQRREMRPPGIRQQAEPRGGRGRGHYGFGRARE
jgi:hypothetical protein